MTTDSRSRQLQRPRELFVHCSGFCPRVTVLPLQNAVNRFSVAKLWQRSINKELVRGRTILQADSSSWECGRGKKEEGDVCVRKR